MNKIILASLLLFSLLSCKKKDSDTPASNTPRWVLWIQFGFQKPGWLSVSPYADQNHIHSDTMLKYNNFGLIISESQLPNSFELETDSMVFEFDLNTKNDQEHFNSRKNAELGVHWTSNGFGFGGELKLPVRFNVQAIPMNDTIEINTAFDYIVVDYISRHSEVHGSDSISIHP